MKISGASNIEIPYKQRGWRCSQLLAPDAFQQSMSVNDLKELCLLSSQSHAYFIPPPRCFQLTHRDIARHVLGTSLPFEFIPRVKDLASIKNAVRLRTAAYSFVRIIPGEPGFSRFPKPRSRTNTRTIAQPDGPNIPLSNVTRRRRPP